MTVSRALNHPSRVNKTTREKVLKAVAELNYRPNQSARTLASKRSFFLGMLYDNPSAGYVNQFLLGALKSCRAKSYHLVVDECADDLESTLDIVRALISVNALDGVILLPPVCDIPEVLQLLREREVPIVRVAPDRDLGLSHYVCMDDYRAAYDMTSYLLELGHKDVGFIRGHTNQGASRLRYQGFLDALRSKGVNVPPEYIEQGYFDYKSGMDAAERLISLKNRPSAIFASNDEMAAAVVATAHKHKLDVPGDISIVGFDDTQIASVIWPQLTTIRQPIVDMAHTAVDILTSDDSPTKSDFNISDYRHVHDFSLISRDSALKYNS